MAASFSVKNMLHEAMFSRKHGTLPLLLLPFRVSLHEKFFLKSGEKAKQLWFSKKSVWVMFWKSSEKAQPLSVFPNFVFLCGMGVTTLSEHGSASHFGLLWSVLWSLEHLCLFSSPSSINIFALYFCLLPHRGKCHKRALAIGCDKRSHFVALVQHVKKTKCPFQLTKMIHRWN